MSGFVCPTVSVRPVCVGARGSALNRILGFSPSGMGSPGRGLSRGLTGAALRFGRPPPPRSVRVGGWGADISDLGLLQ